MISNINDIAKSWNLRNYIHQNNKMMVLKIFALSCLYANAHNNIDFRL